MTRVPKKHENKAILDICLINVSQADFRCLAFLKRKHIK